MPSAVKHCDDCTKDNKRSIESAFASVFLDPTTGARGRLVRVVVYKVLMYEATSVRAARRP